MHVSIKTPINNALLKHKLSCPDYHLKRPRDHLLYHSASSECFQYSMQQNLLCIECNGNGTPKVLTDLQLKNTCIKSHWPEWLLSRFTLINMSIRLIDNVDVKHLSSCCEAKPQLFVNIYTTYQHIIHNFAHTHTLY